MELIRKYFPGLSGIQSERFSRLLELYPVWNSKINVISRKDIGFLEERHILHSLSLAKIIQFSPGTEILDAGTGGGFPGIPLAVFFPEAEFLLVDSIGKKIRVVEDVSAELGLDNVKVLNTRYESIQRKFDFITGRAVTSLQEFTSSLKKNVRKQGKNAMGNGILYLKGGEAGEDLKNINAGHRIFSISDYFSEEFFETKKAIHLFNII
jgi:16S rRNA (guanine527-N7)-methyltransferase